MYPGGKASITRLFRRSLAAVCAAAILAGQLVAAGHYHQEAQAGRAGATPTISANAGPCEICLLASHCAAPPVAAPVIRGPRLEARPAILQARAALRSFDPAGTPTRAPPAFV